MLDVFKAMTYCTDIKSGDDATLKAPEGAPESRMTTTDLTANLAPVFRDASAVAFFSDKATGYRRYYVSQYNGRFVIEDSSTMDRHSIDVASSSFARLVAHVAGVIGHDLTTEEPVVAQSEIAPSDAWAVIHAKWNAR